MIIDLQNNVYNITACNITYTRTSGDVANLSIKFIRQDDVKPSIPEALQHHCFIELYKGERKLMSGHIVKPVLRPTKYSYYVDLPIHSALAMFYQVPYCPPSSYLNYSYINLSDQLQHIVNHARSYGSLSFTLDLGAEFSNTYAKSFSGISSCGSALTSLLSWVPNTRVVMEYSSDGDKLLIGGTSEALTLEDRILTNADGDVIGECKGIESMSLTPRYDLKPDCVTVVVENNISASFGDTSKVFAPNSILYSVSSNLASASDIADTPVSYAGVQSLRQKETVKGTLISKPIVWDTPNTTESRSASAAAFDFWKAFPAFWQLRKIDKDSVKWGNLHIDVLDGETAYPAETDDPDEPSPVPYNYDASPEDWTNVYMLSSGSFAASTDHALCTPGIKFCRAVIEQNVALLRTEAKPANLTYQQMLKWLQGRFSVSGEGEYYYTTLRCECILINRKTKKYYPLTNELDPSDSDYEAPEDEEEEEGSGTGENDDYALAVAGAEIYYNATRQLFYDGSITLRKYSGQVENILACDLSLVGLADAWETMNSPIVSMSYNTKSEQLTINVGSREIETIDEYASRMSLTQTCQQQELAKAITPTINEEEEEEEEEEETDNGVSSITAGYSAFYTTLKDAEVRKPSEVYAIDDTWYIEGDKFPSPNGLIEVETEEIADYNPEFKYVWGLKKSGNTYEGEVIEIPKKNE